MRVPSYSSLFVALPIQTSVMLSTHATILFATIVHVIPLFFTIMRIYRQISRSKFGADDALASIALLCIIPLIVGTWIRSGGQDVGPIHQMRVIGYMLTYICFTCVVWAARLSILLTIIRMMSAFNPNLHRFSMGFVFLFAVMWAALLVLKTYVCERNPEWKAGPNVQCPLGHNVAIVEIITNGIADTILVVLPLRILPPRSGKGRRLLIAVFSASIVTTIAGIIHSILLMIPSTASNPQILVANIEAALAVTICSLPILVFWFARDAFIMNDTSESLPCTESVPVRDSDEHSLHSLQCNDVEAESSSTTQWIRGNQ